MIFVLIRPPAALSSQAASTSVRREVVAVSVTKLPHAIIRLRALRTPIAPRAGRARVRAVELICAIRPAACFQMDWLHSSKEELGTRVHLLSNVM